MSERIKLPAQEWLGYDPERGDIHGYTPEQMREFAELIIRECIGRVTFMSDGIKQFDPENTDGIDLCDVIASDMKQHFELHDDN